jgi:RHH-type rel operon transcriptional repressor/antitoxin RelB
MSTAVSIRLSDDIAHELEGLARTIERSKTYIIRKAVESYLQEYADYSVAIERLNDKDDEIISSDEMGNRLAL